MTIQNEVVINWKQSFSNHLYISCQAPKQSLIPIQARLVLYILIWQDPRLMQAFLLNVWPSSETTMESGMITV